MTLVFPKVHILLFNLPYTSEVLALGLNTLLRGSGLSAQMEFEFREQDPTINYMVEIDPLTCFIPSKIG